MPKHRRADTRHYESLCCSTRSESKADDSEGATSLEKCGECMGPANGNVAWAWEYRQDVASHRQSYVGKRCTWAGKSIACACLILALASPRDDSGAFCHLHDTAMPRLASHGA